MIGKTDIQPENKVVHCIIQCTLGISYSGKEWYAVEVLKVFFVFPKSCMK